MRSKDYSNIKDKFRPGHADYTYLKNMELEIIGVVEDHRLGDSARVAAGAVAKKVWKTKLEKNLK